eukprot:7784744-Pyramimonas_sp.AAC.1
MFDRGARWEFSKKTLASKKTDFSWREALLLRQVWCASNPARALIKKWVFTIDEICPHCGCKDTLWHRIRKCPHAESTREEVFGRLFRQALEAGEDHPLFARGWVAKLDLVRPESA